MKNTKLYELSSLVLVDILAALPMENVVRMACLGHERLRQTASLRWVTDRMTHVEFEAVVKTSEMERDVTKTFCADSVMKRLKGKISVGRHFLKKTNFMKIYVDLAKQVPGRLFFSWKTNHTRSSEVYKQVVSSMNAMSKVPNVTFASQVGKRRYYENYMIWRSPSMIFEYRYTSDHQKHEVYYRSALLNGRHIVDVLRAVCGPADVSEAELDRVRREATERSSEIPCVCGKLHGMWETSWLGVAVTVEV